MPIRQAIERAQNLQDAVAKLMYTLNNISTKPKLEEVSCILTP
jgi:hypothetical protein